MPQRVLSLPKHRFFRLSAQLGRAAKGRSLANLLALGEAERVQATLPVRSFTAPNAVGEEAAPLTRERPVTKADPSCCVHGVA